MKAALTIRVTGVVQGVGFRPFVYRLAQSQSLAGWVLNEEGGVEIHLEGPQPALDAFVRALSADAPAAAKISAIDVHPCEPSGLTGVTIRESRRAGRPTVRISPDLPVCDDCLAELRDPANPRYEYPYINCTNCGPRYTVIERLPYDRPNTTMKHWPLDTFCSGQYHDPGDRRFHAQPVACPGCGPRYVLEVGRPSRAAPDLLARQGGAGRPRAGEGALLTSPADSASHEGRAGSLPHIAAHLLNEGRIVAVKGIGGYHLACDARNAQAVRALRERKFRKEKPFAVMARNLEIARKLVDLGAEAERLLTSPARPIVLAPKRAELAEVAPDNRDLGVMLPYAPLHYLLFDAGAPNVLVMTSANRSSEPIAYRDDEARKRLSGIADAFLIGERPIARRVDDSVARVGAYGPAIVRRSRGHAPGAVTTLPVSYPILAVGADLKNTITLVANGQAFVSQHIGDLDDYESRQAFEETIRDLLEMYEVDPDELVVVHDAHPGYASTLHAAGLDAARKIAVQHHRAHVASVLAERGALDERVIGVSFDGTGYGDDGTIWGGEFFAGSVNEGFQRVGHLRTAILPGGDAAARNPMQCAAGFLSQMEEVPDLAAPPFGFTRRYRQSLRLVEKRLRTFETTSMGRLFDAAAALLGFTREISFEGQAAMWLEYLARGSRTRDSYPFPDLDYAPLLTAVMDDQRRGRAVEDIARAFQRAIAEGLCSAAEMLAKKHGVDTVVLSGGVFQNELLLEDVKSLIKLEVWTNAAVPPNDGGISLGQAALSAVAEHVLE